jgi:predicted dehydrogenase
MKILIAGLGSIGRRHLRNLISLGQTDLVLLRSGRATLPDDELAGFPVETELGAALSKHKPDAVVVSNPTALHLDVAVPAARAGCHLLLEKPVSNSPARLDELARVVEQSGSRVLVGFQFRYHPTLVKARELLRSNALGPALTARAHWGEYLPDWHPWEDYRQGYAARADLGGGVILTLTHPLDYLRFLLGEIEALWSFNGRVSALEIDVEDMAEIGLRFAGGALGSVHLNYVQRPPLHRLEIVGANGTLRWDNSDGRLQLFKIPAQFGTWSAAAPTLLIESHTPPEGFERNHLFLDQAKHFIDVVDGKAAPVCTLADGARALELALAAYESQRTGRVVRPGSPPIETGAAPGHA